MNRMPERPTPLYVRLAADQARRLDQAVSTSGKTKRQLVEDAVREHLKDDGLPVRRVRRDDAPQVLTVSEASSLLRVSSTQLLRAAQQGELPGRQIADDWRFSRAALLAWLHGKQAQGDETTPG